MEYNSLKKEIRYVISLHCIASSAPEEWGYSPCPREKEATLIFDITLPPVEKFFFTIFEASCSGIISA